MFRRSSDLQGNYYVITLCFYKIGVRSMEMVITPKHVEEN